MNAFREAFRALSNRIRLFVALPFESSIASRSVARSMPSAGRQTAREFRAVSGTEATEPHRAKPALGFFERTLTLWVAGCILAGMVLGRLLPGAFHAAGAATLAQVNLPIAVLVWLMIVPMLLRVDPRALRRCGRALARHGRQRSASTGWSSRFRWPRWVGCSWAFLFRDWLPAAQIDQYIAGLILLAAAPCTAMVFVWSNLVDGDPHFTLTQVALNDTIMIVAFAPIVGSAAGPVGHRGAVEHAAAFGGALHRRAGDAGAALASAPAGARRRGGTGAQAEDARPDFDRGAAGDAGAAVRAAGRSRSWRSRW